MADKTPAIEVRPAGPDRWADVEHVLGPKGAYGGCWCMFFRLSGREFEHGAGEANRRSLRALVCDRTPAPGLVAYLDGVPVGWCAVAPRADYPRVLRSPINRPAPDDDQADASVWAVTCFYVRRGHRRTGVAATLLAAAVDFAVEHGARIVEGYPNDAGGREAHPLSLFMGTPELFKSAGFTEHLRRKPRRPVMRYQAG